MAQERSDFDTPWKQILDKYFEHFIAYCWPQKYPEIDWKKGYTLLDKELKKIQRKVLLGNRVVDKLIKVFRSDGQETWVLIHLEIQQQVDPQFEERMFVYRYRLHDWYRKPVASVAVLIDDDPTWRPGMFQMGLWDSSIEMRFPIIKILDYQNQREALECSNNFFAPVLLAQLESLEKRTAENRLQAKLSLTRRLYEKGWDKSDIIALYTFIDWILILPEELELDYHQQVEEMEEELKVAYITTAERIGIQKGLEQGLEQGIEQGLQQGVAKGLVVGERIALECLLQEKFQNIPSHYQQQLLHADPERLLKWIRRVLESESLEAVFSD